MLHYGKITIFTAGISCVVNDRCHHCAVLYVGLTVCSNFGHCSSLGCKSRDLQSGFQVCKVDMQVSVQSTHLHVKLHMLGESAGRKYKTAFAYYELPTCPTCMTAFPL